MTNDAKKQILNNWQSTVATVTLLETKYVDFRAEAGNATFLKLLEQYQNIVVNIGTSIEHLLPEVDRQVVIALLEQYCEGIYQLAALISDEAEYREVVSVLKELMQLITAHLNALPVKKEFLFLPYKFSMWDALESIYTAASEDENCDAVVMPIPYIEYNKDKTSGRWVYEGDEYKEIPIASYKEYNLEEHKPDVIFIHNPFDQYNTVTSVAKEYYTPELKKHCQKLVYVPYFFAGAVLPDMHLSLPTYTNMDYIVVPSKEAAEVMSKYVTAEKLLPLGSPKIDRMILMNQKREMPSEWKKRIGNKKAIMLNVGISGLLQNRFRTILKMRYIFDYFKQRDDIVLWWRPHPLIKSTMQSMCPELLGAYMEMEKAYVLENIGIYDTTADSNIAVAACDAFLGDYSSMANLFGMLGKPVFLLDGFSREEPSREARRQMWLGGVFVRPNNHYLMLDSGRNVLFDLNPKTGEIKLERKLGEKYLRISVVSDDKFDREFKSKNRRFPKREETAQCRIFPQEKDGTVLSYNMLTDELVEYNSYEVDFKEYSLVYEKDGELILMPGSKNRWAYYNIETKELTTYGGYEQLQVFIEKTEEPFFTGGVQLIEDRAYMCSYRTNILVEFDLKKRTSKCHIIGEENLRFSSFFCDEYEKDTFWFFAWDGSRIVKWNKKKGVVGVLDAMPNGFVGRGGAFANPYTAAFAGIVNLDDKIILFPNVANQILMIHKKDNTISQWKPELHYEEGQRKSSIYNRTGNYSAVWLLPDCEHILAQTSYDGSLLLIEIETGKVEKLPCQLSEEEYAQWEHSVEDYCRKDPNSGIYQYKEDGMHCGLSDMMDYFMSGADLQPDRQREATLQGTENVDGSCGQKVFEVVMKKII